MSAAEVVERAEYSEDDPLGEDAGCDAFKSHGVTDMGSSNLLRKNLLRKSMQSKPGKTVGYSD